MIKNDQIWWGGNGALRQFSKQLSSSRLSIFFVFPGRVGITGGTLNSAIYLSRTLQSDAWNCIGLTVLGRDNMNDDMICFVEAEDIGAGAIDGVAHGILAARAISVDEQCERTLKC